MNKLSTTQQIRDDLVQQINEIESNLESRIRELQTKPIIVEAEEGAKKEATQIANAMEDAYNDFAKDLSDLVQDSKTKLQLQ